ncbi:MAG TPA: arginine--tRNA ligase [Candidatus Paceibacterota bacterium]|nr:arginine--tRNA ligase [Candidatus Paceibacterota bacterium]
MKDKIQKKIQEVLKNLNIDAKDIVLEHPADTTHGDYSTNVAMVYAKQLKINPRELAEKLVELLPKQGFGEIEKVEVAGAGFINFYLSHDFFRDSIKEILKQKENWGKNNLLSGKKIMVEYTDPNPFKPFHIGHLMTNAIGESVARIVEFSGAKTVRANYQGDVGPHVAKAIYGIMNDPLRLEHLPLGKGEAGRGVSADAKWIGECYSKGSNLYDTDEVIKKEIDEINKEIYDRSDEEINKIYDWGRGVTLEAFEEIYKLLGTKFDCYFFESEMAKIGEKIVRANMPNVFEKSDGAIIFKAEKYDPKLHTRVFINSQGLPTYETKEIGLTLSKFRKKYPFSKTLDLSIVTTAIEQAEYMKVVQKAISIIYPDLESKMLHITHGMMRFASGKMSSRKGNVVTGESLIQDSMDVVREKLTGRDISEKDEENIAKIVGVSALKYSILKSSLGSDIVYDFDKSISFEGDSGPYLQYTAVRAKSILNKAKGSNFIKTGKIPEQITNLERLLYQFPEVVKSSYNSLEPHYIATYLTELASAFNTFYGNTIILDKNNKYIAYHLELVKSFYQTMKNGLWLLGIETPEKM